MNKKRIMISVLLSIMIIGCFVIYPRAASRGDSISFSISLSKSYNGVKSASLALSYDSTALELVSGEWTVSGAMLSTIDINTGVGAVAYSAETSLSGTVATVKFKIKDNAPFGNYSITATLSFEPTKESEVRTIGTVSVICSHNYGNWSKKDNDLHSRVCAICGHEETVAHTWGSEKITKQANCKETGIKTYTCTGCGTTKTEVIPKTTTHTWNAWAKVDGEQHKHICTVCNQEEVSNHTWNAGTVTKAATCKETGEKTLTCTACSATKTEVIEKTTIHVWGNWEKVDDNTHKHVCTVCNKEETASHSWNAGTVTKAATCKEPGVKTFTCTVCGATKTEEIAKATTHTWSAWTKSSDTEHKRTCSVCDKEEAQSHSYSTAWQSDVNSHYHICSVCGDKKDLSSHTPGASATESRPQTCTTCGYIITPALGHTHVWATEWTTDENGHWYTCSGCNEKKDASKHAYDNGCDPDCNICGFTRTTEHQFEMMSDETSHWQECKICGETKDKESHVPGPEATEKDPQICQVCGYVIEEAKTEETTKGNGDYYPTETESSKVENKVDWTDGSSPLPWILGIIGGVGVLAVIAIILVKNTRKRKQ